MTVQELTDAEIEQMRQRGELVCRCRFPRPVPVWDSYQCDRCYKLIEES